MKGGTQKPCFKKRTRWHACFSIQEMNRVRRPLEARAPARAGISLNHLTHRVAIISAKIQKATGADELMAPHQGMDHAAKL